MTDNAVCTLKGDSTNIDYAAAPARRPAASDQNISESTVKT